MKPVIFIDFGGVYFEYNPSDLEKFSKKINIPMKKIQKVLWDSSLWNEHAAGKLDERDYLKKVSLELNISSKDMVKLRKITHDYSSPHEKMKILVERLRSKYKVVALSSLSVPLAATWQKKYNIQKHFDMIHYSFDYHIDKPDVGLFLLAAKKVKVDPKNCIVIDDMEKFLEAVSKTGARTILFNNSKHSVEQLETQLRKMGIEV